MNSFQAEHFISKVNNTGEGRVTWEAPSNIALVKYWGRFPTQIPANPSLSFTLSKCFTRTSIYFSPKKGNGTIDYRFLFNGLPKPTFKPKLKLFFERIKPYQPFLSRHTLYIDTKNSFPHSSGIASSASAFAALALCLVSVEALLLDEEFHENFLFRKASFLARLGSGSASRSIKGSAMLWGKTSAFRNSSDLYAISVENYLHPVFKSFRNTVLIVDSKKKKVSSTQGHRLMQQNPFAPQRFRKASDNIVQIKSILKSGDLSAFLALVESEALMLHAMMLSSTPYFILLAANTIRLIETIIQFRKETKIPVGFSLDAGANVHLLYPDAHQQEVQNWISSELIALCDQKKYINDQIGFGGKKTIFVKNR